MQKLYRPKEPLSLNGYGNQETDLSAVGFILPGREDSNVKQFAPQGQFSLNFFPKIFELSL